MLLLTLTTDKLSIISSATGDIDVHASYIDYSGTTITPGRQNTNITTATTTDVVASPASSTTRNIKTINIRNADAALPMTLTVQFNQNGTLFELHKATLLAGEAMEYVEGIGFFLLTNNIVSVYTKILTADDTGGQAINTVQPWFPTAGALTVPATTTFHMEGLLKITSGATSHTTAVGFGGTATLTSIGYYAQAHRSAADTIISVFSGINVISATSAVVDVAGTQVAHYILINGIIRINATGTLIPQFTFSANPTGTITIKKDSFFLLTALGSNTLASTGTWA